MWSLALNSWWCLVIVIIQRLNALELLKKCLTVISSIIWLILGTLEILECTRPHSLMPVFRTRAKVYVTSFSGSTEAGLSVVQNSSQLFGKLSPFCQLCNSIQILAPGAFLRSAAPSPPAPPSLLLLTPSVLPWEASEIDPQVVELFYLVFVGLRTLESAKSLMQFNGRMAKVLNLLTFYFLTQIQCLGPCFGPLMNYVVTKISSRRLGLADWQKITKALFRQVL